MRTDDSLGIASVSEEAARRVVFVDYGKLTKFLHCDKPGLSEISSGLDTICNAVPLRNSGKWGRVTRRFQVRRVLFIDVRNATRSQMAEAWFNRLADGYGVATSCGTMPAKGMDPLTVQVMQEIGIDVRHRRPKAIDQQTWQSAQLIVLMGKDINPDALQPTHIWDFQEVVGCPIQDVRMLRDRVRERVQRLIAEIQMQDPDAITAELQWQTIMQNILR